MHFRKVCLVGLIVIGLTIGLFNQYLLVGHSNGILAWLPHFPYLVHAAHWLQPSRFARYRTHCYDMQKQFGVRVRISWGRLPGHLQKVWRQMGCDTLAQPLASSHARKPVDKAACTKPVNSDERMLDKIKVWSSGNGATSETESKVHLVCMVYALAKETHKMEAQYDTWGKQCDRFLFMTDRAIDGPSARLPHVVVEHDGPEAWDNMWQKVRKACIQQFERRRKACIYSRFVGSGSMHSTI